MKRLLATRHITKTTTLKKVNLTHFTALQVKDLAIEGMCIITTGQIEKMVAERNERAAVNSRLSLENARLKDEVAKGKDLYHVVQRPLTDMSEKELATLGLVTIKKAKERIDFFLENSQKALIAYRNSK